METISNKVQNLQEYLYYIKEFREGYVDKRTDDAYSLFFRGECKQYEMSMQPYIFRDGYRTNEEKIFNRVTSICADDFNDSMTTCEILAKMQHYGIPTRLIDITANPLVALYFACENYKDDKNREDGFVYMISPPANAVKYYDSPHVCMLACLARVDNETKKRLSDLFPEDPDNMTDSERESINTAFNEDNQLREYRHYIRAEKSDFDEFTDITDLFRDVILIPRHNNARIIRQSGAFIITSLACTNWGEDKTGKYYSFRDGYYRIIIPGESKRAILDDLKQLNITKATLFPELYTVAESVRAMYANNPT